MKKQGGRPTSVAR